MAAPVPVWRLIRDGPAPGAWNMSADEALLLALGRPVLRLYRWARPTLSLGYRQPPPHLPPGSVERVDQVRRVTGGGTVLHAGDLTYAVVAPRELAGLPGDLMGSYGWIRAMLLRALQSLGIAAAPARGAAGAERATLCFAASTGLEIELGVDKLVGSAQRRTAWGFLQHGSIRVADDSGLYRDLFGSAVGASLALVAGDRLSCTADDIEDALAKSFGEALDGRLEAATYTAEELALARERTSVRACDPLTAPELSSSSLRVCADSLP